MKNIIFFEGKFLTVDLVEPDLSTYGKLENFYFESFNEEKMNNYLIFDYVVFLEKLDKYEKSFLVAVKSLFRFKDNQLFKKYIMVKISKLARKSKKHSDVIEALNYIENDKVILTKELYTSLSALCLDINLFDKSILFYQKAFNCVEDKTDSYLDNLKNKFIKKVTSILEGELIYYNNDAITISDIEE